MKLSSLLALSALDAVIALPSFAARDDPFSSWAPPGPGDVRAPCPMLSTLANHGFLNHSGKNITEEQITYAFGTYLNFNDSLSHALFNAALSTVPGVSNETTAFDLDDLSRHNVLEHDGSLSRLDAYFGDNHDFDEHTFDQTKSYFLAEEITLQQAANARLARMYTSNATNPTFNLSDTGVLFSFGETAAYLLVFGNAEGTSASRELVEYFFENERLPTSLGWTRPASELTEDGLFDAIQRVELATGGSFPYPVPPAPASSATKRSLAGSKGSWHGVAMS